MVAKPQPQSTFFLDTPHDPARDAEVAGLLDQFARDFEKLVAARDVLMLERPGEWVGVLNGALYYAATFELLFTGMEDRGLAAASAVIEHLVEDPRRMHTHIT